MKVIGIGNEWRRDDGAGPGGRPAARRSPSCRGRADRARRRPSGEADVVVVDAVSSGARPPARSTVFDADGSRSPRSSSAPRRHMRSASPRRSRSPAPWAAACPGSGRRDRGQPVRLRAADSAPRSRQRWRNAREASDRGPRAQARGVAAEEGGSHVTRIRVRLGALSHFTPEHFREHFDDAAAGTLAEGAEGRGGARPGPDRSGRPGSRPGDRGAGTRARGIASDYGAWLSVAPTPHGVGGRGETADTAASDSRLS